MLNKILNILAKLEAKLDVGGEARPHGTTPSTDTRM